MSVRYWSPSRIWIGANCEIRHGTFLDARSSKDIAIQIGDGSRIKDYVGFATYGGEIQLSKNVLVGRCSTIFGHGGVYIGNNTMISPHTLIVSTDHLAYLGNTPFQGQGFTREPIYIGENVWIGANACILAGSTIASNVVVGAGAVVRGSLPSGWLYGGIPAEPIKPLDVVHKPEDLTVYTRDWDLLD
ncbi:MAG: acyltransferase [Anaerolineae bacterium]